MGATTDKVKGTANEAIGKAKQGVGEAVGSDKLQGEGAIQEVRGKAQQALGERQGSHQGWGQQGRRRREQESLIDDERLELERPVHWAGLFLTSPRLRG